MTGSRIERPGDYASGSRPQFAQDLRNGGISHWFQQLGVPALRSPLPGDVQLDVAIVGGGMTGLWSAYYLKRAQPDLRIAIIEKDFVGFGASGRNGGWLSAEGVGLFRHYARERGHATAVSLQREMFNTVDETIAVLAREGIEADVLKDGLMYVATNVAQKQRIHARYAALAHQGWRSEDLHWLGGDEVVARVNVANAQGGYWTPHCARINPAKLTFGLASAVERLGVQIYEGTTAFAIRAGSVITDRGTVRADVVVRALEGYTGSLQGQRRRFLPMNSSILVTEPLPEGVWDEIGWDSACLLADGANSYAYLQHTADGRIAIGGRGVPYNFASRFDASGRTAGKAIGQLQRHLTCLFPATRDVRLAHTWSGVLGVSRDWCGSVEYDPSAGVVAAGGYAGHGVSGTNLAGRTVRDLVLGESTDLVRLPWVNHRSPRWEPEPLRWIGASGLYAAYRFADRLDQRSGKPSPIGRFADLVSGRY